MTCSNGKHNDIQNKTTTDIRYPYLWLEDAGYQFGQRVYDIESLKSIQDVRYTCENVNVTGDVIEYIREHHTG